MQQPRRLEPEEVLWQAGEPARTIAVVRRGKLAARSQSRVVGVMYPDMVLGEAALLGIGHAPESRTHTVYAIEDGCEVREYPADLVKQMLDRGAAEVTPLLLRTLVGQSCRNWLLIASANAGRAHIEAPLRHLAIGLLESLASLEAIRDWQEFLVAFRFLYNLRDLSNSERDRMVAPSQEAFEEVLAASHTLRWLFRGQHAAVHLEAFIESERERRSLERTLVPGA